MKLTDKDKLQARESYKKLNDGEAALRNYKRKHSVAPNRIELKSASSGSVAATRSMPNQRGSAGLKRGIATRPLKNPMLSLSDFPPQAISILKTTLKLLAEGKEVTVTAQPEELTTQQAADFLRVSRPFLVGLLEKGEIPFHKVGTHRRIGFGDLQAYKEKIDAQRLSTLEELTKQAQELNMGY